MKRNCIASLTTSRTVATAIVLLLSLGLVSADNRQFANLYDYYFPNNEYQNGDYRRWFDSALLGSAPKPSIQRHPIFNAFRGDPAAFRAFVRHPDRSGEGEFRLTWSKECLVLLLGLGDDRFSTLLGKEDKETREAVGVALDVQVNWSKHMFPKTRALYSYRYIRPSQQLLERKHGDGVRRLLVSLAQEERFRGVRVYNRNDQGGHVLISVPKGLGEKDKSDLRRLVRQCVGDDGLLVTE
jgi:hypothetical protein